MIARRGARAHLWALCLLVTIFLMRVVAQPMSLLIESRYLPPFDAWHSGAVPYVVLLASQVLVLAVACVLIRGVASGTARPRRRLGRALLAAGAVYAGVMLARLALGATTMSGHGWFDRPVPSVFHVNLAALLLVYGDFHRRFGTE